MKKNKFNIAILLIFISINLFGQRDSIKVLQNGKLLEAPMFEALQKKSDTTISLRFKLNKNDEKLKREAIAGLRREAPSKKIDIERRKKVEIEASAEQKFNDFWVNKLDKTGNATQYAKYFAEKYAMASLSSSTSNSCIDDCNNSCFNHNWRYFGPEKSTPLNQPNSELQVNGMVTSIWVHPTNDQQIRIGSRGGLWETKDGGSNWKSLTDACLSGISVNYIAVQPNNPDIIYISSGLQFGGQGYGFGIYKSINGGLTWNRLNANAVANVDDSFSHKIIIHPVNYNILYAIIGYKLYKSIDYGTNWNIVVFSNINELVLRDLEIVTNGGVDNLYISSQHKIFGYGCGYTGTGPCNNSATGCVNPITSPSPYFVASSGTYCDTRYTAMAWQIDISTNSNVPILVTLLQPIINYPLSSNLVLFSVTNNFVYLIAFNENIPPNNNLPTALIYRKGLNNVFTSSPYLSVPILNVQPNHYFSGTNAPSACTFDVSASDNIYIGGTQLFKKGVNGNLFAQTYSYFDYSTNSNAPHADVRCNLIYKSSINQTTDVLFFGTDGGVSKTINSGTTFTNLNGNGLQLTDVWGISNSEKYPNLVAFGTQDNGLFSNSMHNWVWTSFGDGYDCVTDKNNPYNIISSNNGGGPTKINSLNGNQSSLNPYYGGGGKLFLDNSNTLFRGWNNNLSSYNLTNNSGSSIINNFLGSKGAISGLNITKNNIGYVCFNGITWGNPSNTGIVYKISNLSSTAMPSDITNGLDAFVWASATDLIAEPIVGDKVWVSFNGAWDVNRKVMMFNTNNQWVQYGQGLPNIPVNTLEYYEGSNDLLFAGTDEGVYFRDATMATWQKFSCGLPNVIITDLEINYKLKQLRAATLGRGVWETQIPVK